MAPLFLVISASLWIGIFRRCKTRHCESQCSKLKWHHTFGNTHNTKVHYRAVPKTGFPKFRNLVRSTLRVLASRKVSKLNSSKKPEISIAGHCIFFNLAVTAPVNTCTLKTSRDRLGKFGSRIRLFPLTLCAYMLVGILPIHTVRYKQPWGSSWLNYRPF